ncbi:vitamin K epoxide reductase family protein [Candidatus Woesearchaeota archaeon]|nr:vitamin K epoxide reductase family protein [Candidatus Woesearchaeota archaeon]
MNEYVIIILAILGFIISFIIWHAKINNKKLVCVIGQDCNKVINSKYSKTLGINNEVLGMLYYSLLIIISIAMLKFPSFSTINIVNMGRMIITLFSALFSIYLTYVQIFRLKEYCEYCWSVNIINIIIFLVILF